MRSRVVVLTTVCLFAIASRCAHAQQIPASALVRGDTIRVWAVAPALDGETRILAELRRDTLRLSDFARPPALIAAIPMSALRRVEVRRGSSISKARVASATLFGVVAGAFIGGFVGKDIECGSHCQDLDGLGGFVVGGLVGILVGGIGGEHIAERARVPSWYSVDLKR